MNGILNGLIRRPPGATDELVAAAQKQLGTDLPEQFVQFLKVTNGPEGYIGENAYVMLWEVEDLASLNAAYEVQTYAPGLLIFGSDGGGEAYGFDTRSTPWTIVRMPFIGMEWSMATQIASTFDEFLEHLRNETE